MLGARRLLLRRAALSSSLSPKVCARSIGGAPGWRWHEDGSNILKGFIEFGPILTIRKLLHMKEVKFGHLVGIDHLGNSYYENNNYQYGRHRWVEYSGLPWMSEVQSTNVPAEWHGWLHYMTDSPGTDFRVGGGVQNNHGGDALYTTNVGGVKATFQPNKTERRRRGYGDGTELTPEGAYTDMYWKQASHPTAPNGPVYFEPKMEEWTPPGQTPKQPDPKNDWEPTRDLSKA